MATTMSSMVLAASSLAVMLAGCQSGYRTNARNVSEALQKGEYSLAADQATAFIQQADSRDKVAVLMEAGRSCQLSGDLALSIAHYDAADELLRPYLQAKPEALVSEVVSATLVNQTMSTYRGTPGERIMLSTMQALNRLAAGDLANARIDLNRAHDWQQAAVARYQDEITKQQAAMTAESATRNTDVSHIEHPKLASIAESVEDRRGYADFANPFSTYLRGVFLMATSTEAGDLANARTDLRNCVAMVPAAAPVVAADLARLDAARRGDAVPTTWVFLLSGLAPHYEELRLDIPIPYGQMPYVSAAFPVFKPGLAGVDGFKVLAGDTDVNGVMLCDMNEIAGHEYRLRLPGVIVQEVATSAVKAAATWGASRAARSGGDAATAAGIVMLVGLIYQASSTAADLRCWHTMPQRIDVASMPTPADGKIRLLSAAGQELADVEVDALRNNIVAVNLPSGTAVPAVQYARLNGPLESTIVATTIQPPPVAGSTPKVSVPAGRRRVIPRNVSP